MPSVAVASEGGWLMLTVAFAAGACIGSFLNVCIHRIPADESVVHPGSRCPRCQAAIAWYDNVPVLSWAWLRARCRGCGLPISARYPLVEAATGALALLALARFGATPWALVSFAFTVTATHSAIPGYSCTWSSNPGAGSPNLACTTGASS